MLDTWFELDTKYCVTNNSKFKRKFAKVGYKTKHFPSKRNKISSTKTSVDCYTSLHNCNRPVERL